MRVRGRGRGRGRGRVRGRVSAAVAAQGRLEVGVERVVVLVEEVRGHVADVASEVTHLYT